MSQVFIEKAHACHECMHCITLGLLDILLHVVALQLRDITREDSELVEFNAVQKRSPGLHTGSLVRCPVHCDPRILHMHLGDNLVPLSPSFANEVDAK
jgi:hypothetical protein